MCTFSDEPNILSSYVEDASQGVECGVVIAYPNVGIASKYVGIIGPVGHEDIRNNRDWVDVSIQKILKVTFDLV